MIKTNTILIIDDSIVDRKVLSSILIDSYEIIESSSGTEGLRLISENANKLSLVILDYLMPDINGFAVLMGLTKLNLKEKFPVIMLTGHNSTEIENQALVLGVEDFIKKDPFSPAIIKKRVDNTISAYNQRLQLQETVGTQSEKLSYINSKMIEVFSSVIEYRSLESGNHIKRMSIYTKALLNQMAINDRSLHLTPDTIDIIANSAALHDIGKIGIPDSILLKPGRLTSEEFDTIKEHPLFGCQIISNLQNIDTNDYFKYCYEICRYHHERYDGNGYPDGLKGDEIPISAQIVALADVYDALRSVRVYKDALSHDLAVKMIISGECGAFMPILLNVFLDVSEQFRELSQIYSDV